MTSNATQIQQLCNELDRYRPDQVIQELQRHKWYNRAVARAVRRYINKHSEEIVTEFVDTNLWAICLPLVMEFGFGETRMKRYLSSYSRYVLKVRAEYKIKKDETPSYCADILKRRGFKLQELHDCIELKGCDIDACLKD